MRQLSDVPYAQTLNRIRLGTVSILDCNTLKRRLRHSDNIPEDFSDALHIYATNKMVNCYNLKKQELLNSCYISVRATHLFSDHDVSPGAEVPNEWIPPDDRNAGGLQHFLRVSLGTRVMLLRNLLTEQGLVNGAMVVVVHIETTNETNPPQCIYVKFDDSTVAPMLQIQHYSGGIPIDMYHQEYFFRNRYVVRQQFPLTPCWACSVHKVQGLSLDKAVISLGQEIFQAGMSYVALSRVRTTNGIILLAFSSKCVWASNEVLQEYHRLLHLN